MSADAPEHPTATPAEPHKEQAEAAKMKAKEPDIINVEDEKSPKLSELGQHLQQLGADPEEDAEMPVLDFKTEDPDFGLGPENLDGPDGSKAPAGIFGAASERRVKQKQTRRDEDLPMAPQDDETAQNNKRKYERMCAVCLTVAAINKFLFCKSCKRDVQACRADAEKEGRLSDWTRLTKTAEGLRHLVLHYQKTCPSRGQGVRRDSFDWASYCKKVFMVKQCITGTLKQYMDWIDYEKHALSKGLTPKDAMNQWQAWESSNHDHDFKGRKDYEKRFVVAVQDYVRDETVTGEKEDGLLTGGFGCS